jgi:hypothetical protein
VTSGIDISRIHGESAPERLALAIDEIARQSPELVAVVTGAGGPQRRTSTFVELAGKVASIEAGLKPGTPAGVIVRCRTVDAIVAVAAACGRQGIPVALLAIIGSETIASLAGIGHRIVQMAEAMETARMFAFIVFVIVIAASLNALVSSLEKRGAARR